MSSLPDQGSFLKVSKNLLNICNKVYLTHTDFYIEILQLFKVRGLIEGTVKRIRSFQVVIMYLDIVPQNHMAQKSLQ